MVSVRIDKWLWAARFFKTRTLATAAVDAGHARLLDERVKPAKEIRPGDILRIRTAGGEFSVTVRLLAEQRGSAAIAQTLYEESVESREARAHESEKRRRFAEPADAIVARPTKKDRRQLDRFRDG